MEEVRKALEKKIKSVSDAVYDFNEDYPPASDIEAPEEFHKRVLAVGQMRSYLSGQVGEVQKILGDIQVATHNAETKYEVAQIEAAGKVKLKDFDSGEIQKAKMRAETLDEYLVVRASERLLKQGWKALNYVKTHLEEFQRKATDLKLLVDIMYNG